ncbi:MAG: hypothetical protein R3350_00840, partial [Saprospiraceae bacterium]|nr:hypothetical protein [Saprospiraceae bacterium]
RNAQLAIESEGLKDQLEDLFEEKASQENNIRRLNWRKTSWSIAASIAFLVIGYLVFDQLQNPLYEEYKYVDPGLPILMSESSNYELQDALTYYSEGSYETAFSKLRDLYKPADPNDTVSYYLGASQLYRGNAADSRKYFERVIDDSGSPFREKAEWLQALSYLKEGDQKSTQQALDRILSDEDHLFFQKARQLREEIE